MPESLLPVVRSHSPVVDRRSAERFLCNRVCFARPNGTSLGMTWGVTIYDISAHGISLLLKRRLESGSIVAIQPSRQSQTKPILARVLRSLQWPRGWLHGCELAEPLSDAELDAWLS
jgi:hypothetical protein